MNVATMSIFASALATSSYNRALAAVNSDDQRFYKALLTTRANLHVRVTATRSPERASKQPCLGIARTDRARIFEQPITIPLSPNRERHHAFVGMEFTATAAGMKAFRNFVAHQKPPLLGRCQTLLT